MSYFYEEICEEPISVHDYAVIMWIEGEDAEDHAELIAELDEWYDDYVEDWTAEYEEEYLPTLKCVREYKMGNIALTSAGLLVVGMVAFKLLRKK